MFRTSEEGGDIRVRWRQRYNPRKNPWIATSLPPIPTQIQVGTQSFDNHLKVGRPA